MNTVRAGLLAVLGLTFLSTGMAAAADNQNQESQNNQSQKWLTDVAKAVRTGSYEGILIYGRDDQIDTLRVIHTYKDGHEKERLVSESGPQREVIRRGDEVKTILPEEKIVHITNDVERSHLLHRIGELSGEAVAANYTINLEQGQRLAGRNTKEIIIQPKDGYRYGYRINIDDKTSLPLKLVLENKGQTLEQVIFAQLDYPEDIPDKAFKTSFPIDDFKVFTHQPNRVPDSDFMQEKDWQSVQLPTGYQLIHSSTMQNTEGEKIYQILFSDGVASISAFIVADKNHNHLEGGSSLGAVNAYGKSGADYHVTVVGEAPKKTVKVIADNLANYKIN